MQVEFLLGSKEPWLSPQLFYLVPQGQLQKTAMDASELAVGTVHLFSGEGTVPSDIPEAFCLLLHTVDLLVNCADGGAGGGVTIIICHIAYLLQMYELGRICRKTKKLIPANGHTPPAGVVKHLQK